MPPVFGISAPKCPRCGKSVYIAEQVIGPNSTPYHKPCLACVTCNKRLDSTLLVEHDGLPLCKNCHRNHLGQGKGGFGKAVPVRANLPVSPDRIKEPRDEEGEDEDEMVRRLTGINIRARELPASPSTPVRSIDPHPASGITSSEVPTRPRGDWSHLTSLDDLVSSSSDVPRIQPRSEVLRRQVEDIHDGVGLREPPTASPPLPTQPLPSRTTPATPPPKPASLRAAAQAPIPPTSPLRSAAPVTPTSSIRTDGLPAPVRRTPGSTTSTYKVAPAPSPSSFTSSPSRLTTSINSGTPLCARCSKPVYHAEQVTAASGNRVWHRPCLRCDVCSRTLQKGQLEEGPTLLSGDMTRPPLAPNNADTPCNIYCRVCFKKYFGPRGIGAAGMSFPVQ